MSIRHVRQFSQVVRIVAPMMLGLVSFHAKCSFATVLAVIETESGLWMAADSVRGTGTTKTDTACKLHDTKFGLLGKASATQGFTASGEDYSLDKELFALINESESLAQFKERLRERYVQDIYDQMTHLLGAPVLTRSDIERMSFGTPMPEATTSLQFRQIVLVAQEEGVVRMRQLIVAPASSYIPGGGYHYYVRLLNWVVVDRRLLRAEDHKHPSLHQFGIAVDIPQSDDWIRSHPYETLRLLLEKGHTINPTEIGPPYSIVHIEIASKSEPTASGLRLTWFDKGKCPSWNFDIYDLDFTKKNDVTQPE